MYIAICIPTNILYQSNTLDTSYLTSYRVLCNGRAHYIHPQTLCSLLTLQVFSLLTCLFSVEHLILSKIISFQDRLSHHQQMLLQWMQILLPQSYPMNMWTVWQNLPVFRGTKILNHCQESMHEQLKEYTCEDDCKCFRWKCNVQSECKTKHETTLIDQLAKLETKIMNNWNN